ncbi:penicillin-insensitive murein endopeptidase [Desulforhabdus sp. TSK]|uniref:penicillin-insensitive murein endopeptidase n=1 Tax=Desulforhabdus sp. TSK TaxID=2925014 RepID=UPI001FC8CE4B|nr:penicillin-insensitive murein endopeptidase [Desulforhabdus sp. TSK]
MSFSLMFFPILFTFPTDSAQALTASLGQPYHGRLVEGIPFPRQFEGYQLRDEDRTYTTPEVIGALLDALDAVQAEYPSAPDLYFGDFSKPGGGWLSRHRSHQNGRDVDLGMYAKDDRTLSTFIPMNEENLDAAKTWCLIENIIRSQRVQYIFVDKRIQNVLSDYALSQGVDPAYLEHLFGNVRGSIVQHVRNHQDHLHIRFYAPWSTMAAHLDPSDTQKHTAVEMAQQAYLPKRVNYYVKGNERNLDTLARSFGVDRRELCRWNQIHGNEILSPGTCLVFYKRGFEIEPVNLAQSLRPDSVPETQTIRVASLRPTRTLSDAPTGIQEPPPREIHEVHDTMSTRELRDSGDVRENRDKEEDREARDTRNAREVREARSTRDDREARESREVRNTRNTRNTRDSRDSREAREERDSRDTKGMKVSPPITTVYTAKRGDSLEQIARDNDMDVNALRALNGMKKRAELRQGQRIVLLNTMKQSAGADSPPSQAVKYDKTLKSAAPSSQFVKKGEPVENIARLSVPTADTSRKLDNTRGSDSLPSGKKIQLAKVDLSAKTSMNDARAVAAGTKSSKARKSDEKISAGKAPGRTDPKAEDLRQKTAGKGGAPARVAEPAKASVPKPAARASAPASSGTKTAAVGKAAPEKPTAPKSVAAKPEATVKVAGNSKAASKK